MTITRQFVASKVIDYLHHHIALDELVDWAENALMEGELEKRDAKLLSDCIARLGLSDVRAFGLAWEDCETVLDQLGYKPRVEVVTK